MFSYVMNKVVSHRPSLRHSFHRKWMWEFSLYKLLFSLNIHITKLSRISLLITQHVLVVLIVKKICDRIVFGFFHRAFWTVVFFVELIGRLVVKLTLFVDLIIGNEIEKSGHFFLRFRCNFQQIFWMSLSL